MLDTLSSRKVQNLSLVVVAITCLGGLLYFLSGVLVPFTMAIFLYLVISPLIDFQVKRLRLPRMMALVVTLVLATLLLLFGAALMASSLGQLATNASAYEARFQELLWEGLYSVPDEVGAKLNLEQVFNLAITAVTSILGTITEGIVSLLSQFTVVALFLLFFLLGEQKDEEDEDQTWVEIARRTRHYVRAKTGVSAATAALVYLFLSVAGVDFALVLALLTFLLNFIPNVGSLIAIVLPIPVIVLSPIHLSFWAATTVMVLIVIVQFVMGNVVEPKLIGDALELHPVSVLVALLVWGALWGLIGMFLAVPITASLKIVYQKLARDLAEEERAKIVDPERSTMVLGGTAKAPAAEAEEPAEKTEDET